MLSLAYLQYFDTVTPEDRVPGPLIRQTLRRPYDRPVVVPVDAVISAVHVIPQFAPLGGRRGAQRGGHATWTVNHYSELFTGLYQGSVF